MFLKKPQRYIYATSRSGGFSQLLSEHVTRTCLSQTLASISGLCTEGLFWAGQGPPDAARAQAQVFWEVLVGLLRRAARPGNVWGHIVVVTLLCLSGHGARRPEWRERQVCLWER